MTQTTTLQAVSGCGLDMQLECLAPRHKSFYSPYLQCSSYRLLRSVFEISVCIRPKCLTQYISQHTTWKEGSAPWSQYTQKPVRDLQGKTLPDYSFVWICYFSIIDTVLLLWILTPIIVIQCSSSTDFLICAIQKGAAAWAAALPCVCLSYLCISCLIPEWSNSGTVQPSPLLGMIYVHHAAALLEIVLIYTGLQHIFSSN